VGDFGGHGGFHNSGVAAPLRSFGLQPAGGHTSRLDTHNETPPCGSERQRALQLQFAPPRWRAQAARDIAR